MKVSLSDMFPSAVAADVAASQADPIQRLREQMREACEEWLTRHGAHAGKIKVKRWENESVAESTTERPLGLRYMVCLACPDEFRLEVVA